MGTAQFFQRQILAGGAGAVGLAPDGRDRAVGLLRGQAILAFQVIGGLDGDGAEGDDLGAHDHADLLAPEGAAEPVAELGAGGGDGQGLHVS
jgi:hypothetical protein